MIRRARPAGAALLLGAVALFGAVLSGCAPEPPAPEPEPETLTASEAGGVYLDAVCPVNEAWDEVDAQLDLLRIAVARGERDTSRFADALGTLADTSADAADQLDSKDFHWPAAAAGAVDDVRATLEADAEQAERVAKLSAEEIADYAWQGTDRTASAAIAARAALGLPEDPAFACAQWAEQGAGQGQPEGGAKAPQGTDPAKPELGESAQTKSGDADA